MEPDEARAVLIKNFKENPECAETEKAARALIMDSIPVLQAEKNILITLYHEGFVAELIGDSAPQILKSKYILILTKEYGFSEKISAWCIDTWILIFGKTIDPEDVLETESNKGRSYELVVCSSEKDKLLEEIRNLKALIIALTSERDELKYHTCRDLAVEYNNRIGDIELQVLNAKLRVLELKRTVEIIQAQINRQERKSEKKAREQAKKEYEEFEEELNRKAEEARSANKYKEDEAQKEEEWKREQEKYAQDEETDDRRGKYKSRTEEMKALYRKLVKALHPDMNPDVTDEERDLLQEAVDAYNTGDIKKLRQIAALVEEGNLGVDTTGSVEDLGLLKEIIEGLQLRVDELLDEIEKIKESFPYTVKELLEDDEAVEHKQRELTDLLLEYSKQADELEERLSDMLGKQVK